LKIILTEKRSGATTFPKFLLTLEKLAGKICNFYQLVSVFLELKDNPNFSKVKETLEK